MNSKENENFIFRKCLHCRKGSALKILSHHDVPGDIDDAGNPLYLYRIYLCICKHCSEISLIGEAPWDKDEKFVKFPVDKRFITFSLPKIVRTSYFEAMRCEKEKIPIATVVMVGRTLEAALNHILKDKVSIFKGLEELKKKGIISDEIFNWSNELRVLRNIGAHAVEDKIEIIDAMESMDFLQAILEILFHLRPKFEEMKKRREKTITSE